MFQSFLGRSRLPVIITFTLGLITCTVGQDVFETKNREGYTYQELITPFRKSNNDNLAYLGLKLENELEIILVSDPTVDKAAASLNVNVGSFNDPIELPGLAHFCEHLVFTGTKKYPGSNNYTEFLSSHSGSANAFTTSDQTNYMFNVAPEALDGALDRFSQFFITPLFDPNSIEDEVTAVDSEFKGSNNDYRRINEIQKKVANPNHPYTKFSCGNRFSLLENPRAKNIDVRDKLINFHDQFYSANLMKLVVIGKESFDELKSMVIPKFAPIINRNTKIPEIKEKLFNEKHIQINAVAKQYDILTIEFLIPSPQLYYNEKPIDYVIKLLESGSEGSITNELKKKNWITRSQIQLNEDFKNSALFELSFMLTEDGINNQDEIIKTVFSYIKLIKEQGVTLARFQEMQAKKEQEFHDEEVKRSISHAINLSVLMQNAAPLSQKIGSDILMINFDEHLILNFLNSLNPDNMRLTLATKKYKETVNLKTEPLYGAQFSVQNISETFINELNNISIFASMKLPETNPFLVSGSTITKPVSSSEIPILLSNSTEEATWYLNGGLNTTKASFVSMIKNNHQYYDVKNFVLQLLLPNAIKDSFEIEGNWASDAGYFFNVVSNYPSLIIIIIQGYPEKIELVLMSLIHKIKNFNISETEFKSIKDKNLKRLEGFLLNGPLIFVQKITELALLEHTWTDEEILKAMKDLTREDLVNFIDNNILRGYLETLGVGNILESKTLLLTQQVKSTLNLKPVTFSERQYRRMIEFPKSHEWTFTHPLFDIENLNSGIGFNLMMYSHEESIERALTDLVSKLIFDPMMHQLRFVERLGYTVSNNLFDYGYQGGISFYIQSERDPVHLEGRIENYFHQFYDFISNKSESDLYKTIHTLQTTRRNKRYDLFDMTFNYFGAIQKGNYNFLKEKETVENLGRITKSMLLQFIQDRMLTRGKRQKLSIHVVSKKLKPETEPKYTLDQCGTLITNITAWRYQQKLAPYIN